MTLSLARRAERFPDRTAVVDVSEERLYAPAETIHENRVTYGELEGLVGRTAEHLAALGIGAGDVVCLVTRNRVASLALLFACRRLEATLAPISHWLTPATVTRPFAAIDPDLVVSEAAQRDLVRSIPYDRSVTLAELADGDRADATTPGDPGHFDDQRPLLSLHGEDGRPVASYSTHALEWNCLSAIVAWGLSGADVAPLTAPLSTHDGLVRAALPVLYVGGTILLDRAFDPGDALAAIDAEDATVLVGRATAIRDLAAESRFDGGIDSLERVVLEGSVADDVRAAYRRRDVPIVRAAGRLECPTAFAQSLEATTEGGVGPPVPDCRARLVDDAGTVLEGAAEGRLELSGPVVADGYVNAAGTDDGTDSIADETDADRGRFADGWFDTGERFRRDADGTYHRE